MIKTSLTFLYELCDSQSDTLKGYSRITLIHLKELDFHDHLYGNIINETVYIAQYMIIFRYFYRFLILSRIHKENKTYGRYIA